MRAANKIWSFRQKRITLAGITVEMGKRIELMVPDFQSAKGINIGCLEGTKRQETRINDSLKLC